MHRVHRHFLASKLLSICRTSKNRRKLNKMKALKIALVAFFMAAPLTAAPYFETQAGYVTSGNQKGHTLGIRAGSHFQGFDCSFGYARTNADLDSDAVISNGLDLHTLSMEAYKPFYLSNNLTVKFGAGLGYSIPTLSGPEKADSGVSYLIGGGADYRVSENISLGGMVRGLFFHTDTRRIQNDSHIEILSTGQEVEVLDVNYIGGRLDLDSAVITVAVKYLF